MLHKCKICNTVNETLYIMGPGKMVSICDKCANRIVLLHTEALIDFVQNIPKPEGIEYNCDSCSKRIQYRGFPEGRKEGCNLGLSIDKTGNVKCDKWDHKYSIENTFIS